jgi:hypothetical protein
LASARWRFGTTEQRRDTWPNLNGAGYVIQRSDRYVRMRCLWLESSTPRVSSIQKSNPVILRVPEILTA